MDFSFVFVKYTIQIQIKKLNIPSLASYPHEVQIVRSSQLLHKQIYEIFHLM